MYRLIKRWKADKLPKHCTNNFPIFTFICKMNTLLIPEFQSISDNPSMTLISLTWPNDLSVWDNMAMTTELWVSWWSLVTAMWKLQDTTSQLSSVSFFVINIQDTGDKFQGINICLNCGYSTVNCDNWKGGSFLSSGLLDIWAIRNFHNVGVMLLLFTWDETLVFNVGN